MRNFKLNQVCLFTFLFSIIFYTIPAIAQIKTDTKISKPVNVNKNNIDTKPFNLSDSVPYFKNIRPVNISTINKNIISNKNLKPVSKLPKRDFNFTPSSVNGTMTARDPYLNDLAYVEFINGSVLPGDNKVECSCGNGLTFVKLVLTATAGKDYMITTKASPKGVSSAAIDIAADGFVHRSYINSKEAELKVILSPQSSGKVILWMQCADPNGVRTPWTFHSMTVQEVN